MTSKKLRRGACIEHDQISWSCLIEYSREYVMNDASRSHDNTVIKLQKEHKLRSDEIVWNISVFVGIALVLFTSQAGQAEVIVDGTLQGNSHSLTGPDYRITQSLGQTIGGNLFHSFAQFSINRGESATFLSISQINNIFARVTGGNLSTIDGSISSDNAANLWLINPAGWLIGKNAAINIAGDFHLTTANAINFGDHGVFFANPAQASSLSIAEPIDYQFQNAKPATITIDQASLSMNDGRQFSLVGGDIHLHEAHINAPSGMIILASNGESEGGWAISDQGLQQISGTRGKIDIDDQSSSINNPTLSINASVLNQTDSSGVGYSRTSKIELNAENINLKNTFMTALVRNNATEAGGDINLIAENIELRHSRIFTSVLGEQAGGDINISAQELLLTGLTDSGTDGSLLKTDTRYQSYGLGGSISLNLANSLRMSAQSGISSATFGNGRGGNISVHSPLTQLDQQSFMTVETALGVGQAGTLTLSSRELTLNSNSFLESASAQEAQGNAGNIIINSSYMSLNDGYIFASTDKSAIGATGTLQIYSESNKTWQRADDSFLKLHNSFISTSNNSVSQGDGGNISIDTGTLVMYGGYIQANSLAQNGSGGTVTVNAQRSLFSQEQWVLGGNVRYRFADQPELNIIQAAAPFGESGQVNVSRVELNIAGQLAKIDADFVNRTPITNDPCLIRRGEQASSLVQSSNGGLAPNAGDRISLPLNRYRDKASKIKITPWIY